MARNNVKKAKGAPWGVIIFFLIFFFYIGIPLMLSKLHKDKEHMLANAKKTMTVGWIIFGFGVIYMVVCLAEGLAAEGVSGIRTLVIGTAVSCSGGYAIVRHAKKYKMLGLKHERYILAASRLPVGSLDDMAYVLGETFEVTSQNVQDLIDNGLLEDSYIDQTRRILVSPVVGSRYRTQPGQGSADTGDAPQAKDSKPEVRAVKCPNCGGMNHITKAPGISVITAVLRWNDDIDVAFHGGGWRPVPGASVLCIRMEWIGQRCRTQFDYSKMSGDML